MSKRSRFFSSSNPFLNEQVYAKSAQQEVPKGTFALGGKAEHMTVKGAVNKSLILGGILMVSALVAANLMNPMLMWVGMFGGLISLLIAYFNPKSAPITAPLYAVFEGLLLGTISMIFAKFINPGIVLNAILLTVFALVSMLILYRTGVIKVTEKFRSIVFTATAAIAVIYLVNMVMHMFGTGLPYLHEGGIIGIILSLVIIGVACLNLVIDFDQFEKGEQYRAPLHMEWLSAMGLLVTLIWLYLEILRLLSMFASND